MKFFLFATGILLLAVSPLCAQAVLSESVFLPPRFFVGDRVELRLTYELAPETAVEQTDPLPEHPWIEIQDIEIRDARLSGRSGEVRVRIFFIPFYAGQTVLPSLRLGQLDTGELLVETRSALENEQNHSLRVPRRQLRLPLTWIRLLSAAALAVGVPLLFVFLLRFGIRGVARIRGLRIRRLPYLHVRKSLNQLAAGKSSIEGQSYFVLLSLAIRRYLTERLSMPLMSVTTGEIPGELSRAGLEPALYERIHELLKQADLIKFSGRRTNRRAMERSLKSAAGIVEQVEERISHVEA